MMQRMQRAVLVGLLLVSAVACKSGGGDTPKAQPGVAAGKVVEVVGAVTVRQNDVARPLATGQTVEGNDVVETGADGHVVIELSHNLARWELGPNKKSKVSESSAWSLPKSSGTTTKVEETSAAAGRHAERNAADTSVSAAAEATAEVKEPAAPPAAAAPSTGAPPPSRRAEKASDGAAVGASTAVAAGAQSVRGDETEIQREKRVTQRERAKDTGASESVKKEETARSPATSRGMTANAASDAPETAVVAGASLAAAARAQVDTKAIKACLTKDASAVTITINIDANGKATTTVKGKAEVPEVVQKCVAAAIAKSKFASATTTVTLDVSK